MAKMDFSVLMENFKSYATCKGKAIATRELYNKIKNAEVVDCRVQEIFENYIKELDKESEKLLNEM